MNDNERILELTVKYRPQVPVILATTNALWQHLRRQTGQERRASSCATAHTLYTDPAASSGGVHSSVIPCSNETLEYELRGDVYLGHR